jgi:hypothetical protein
MTDEKIRDNVSLRKIITEIQHNHWANEIANGYCKLLINHIENNGSRRADWPSKSKNKGILRP